MTDTRRPLTDLFPDGIQFSISGGEVTLMTEPKDLESIGFDEKPALDAVTCAQCPKWPECLCLTYPQAVNIETCPGRAREKPAEDSFPYQCSNVCDVRKGCTDAHWCQLRSGHDGEHKHLCTVIAELERAVIAAAVVHRKMEVEGYGRTLSEISSTDIGLKFAQAMLAEKDAVDALLKARENKWLST